MCGICGIISTTGYISSTITVEDTVREMTKTLSHRGPDDSGHVLLGQPEETSPDNPLVALGHRRLAVISPDDAHQPLCNENKKIWTVFNGEIYNYQSLRNRLVNSNNHVLNSTGDTECLVHLYEEQGLEFVNDLRGMFALGIWDAESNRLILARDRMGQKPLYYLHETQRHFFAFASELKALMVIPEIDKTISPIAISSYLTYQYVPHPCCIFQNCSKLPPANTLSYLPKKNCIKTSKYWRLPTECDENISRINATEDLHNVLREATKIRMISDAPLGAFLSGGLDSSITVAIMQEMSENPVKTFTIGFDDPRFNEAMYADEVAEYFQTEHKTSYVKPNALSILPKLARHLDEPFGDSSIIPTFYLSHFAAQDVKVVLTGDGGDEMFAGYQRYAAMLLAEKWDNLPNWLQKIALPDLWKYIPVSPDARTPMRKLKRFLTALQLQPRTRYLQWIGIFSPRELKELMHPDYFELLRGYNPQNFLNNCYCNVSGSNIVDCTTKVDQLSYLPCDLLTKVDRASMAHGLETRSPFLDHKVVEAAASIPLKYKLNFRHIRGKQILKNAFKSKLPKSIIKRKKKGFGVPIDKWFRNELSPMVHDLLLSPSAGVRNYLLPEKIDLLVKEHMNGIDNHAYKLWSLLILELWHNNVIKDSG